MGQPYVGEIRMVGFNFAPVGWAFCNGATVPISGNETLFQLIGTTYGGDGQNNFQLPDLQGRVPIHVGINGGAGGHVIGEKSGVEGVTLNVNQIPNHSHVPQGNTGAGNSTAAAGNVWAANADSSKPQFSSTVTAPTAMNAGSGGSAGNSQPHDNMPPFLCINFVISLFGVFPSQN